MNWTHPLHRTSLQVEDLNLGALGGGLRGIQYGTQVYIFHLACYRRQPRRRVMLASRHGFATPDSSSMRAEGSTQVHSGNALGNICKSLRQIKATGRRHVLPRAAWDVWRTTLPEFLAVASSRAGISFRSEVVPLYPPLTRQCQNPACSQTHCWFVKHLLCLLLVSCLSCQNTNICHFCDSGYHIPKGSCRHHYDRTTQCILQYRCSRGTL